MSKKRMKIVTIAIATIMCFTTLTNDCNLAKAFAAEDGIEQQVNVEKTILEEAGTATSMGDVVEHITPESNSFETVKQESKDITKMDSSAKHESVENFIQETIENEENIEIEETSETEETAEAVETVETEEKEGTAIKIVYTATEGGSVTLTEENVEIKEDTEVKGSIAVASEGYQFINWTEGEDVVSTDAVFIPEVKEAVYVANFEQIPVMKNQLSTNVNGIVITATAMDDIFGPDAILLADIIDVNSAVEGAVVEAVEALNNEKVRSVKDVTSYAFDIKIYDPLCKNEGNIYQPDNETITISFSNIDMETGLRDEAKVVYVENPSATSMEDVKVETFETKSDAVNNNVAFEAKHFSTYIVAISGRPIDCILESDICNDLSNGISYSIKEALFQDNNIAWGVSNVHILDTWPLTEGVSVSEVSNGDATFTLNDGFLNGTYVMLKVKVGFDYQGESWYQYMDFTLGAVKKIEHIYLINSFGVCDGNVVCLNDVKSITVNTTNGALYSNSINVGNFMDRRTWYILPSNLYNKDIESVTFLVDLKVVSNEGRVIGWYKDVSLTYDSELIKSAYAECTYDHLERARGFDFDLEMSPSYSDTVTYKINLYREKDETKGEKGEFIETLTGTVADKTDIYNRISSRCPKGYIVPYTNYVITEENNEFDVIYTKNGYNYTINFYTRDIDGIGTTPIYDENSNVIKQTGIARAGEKIIIEHHCPNGFKGSSIHTFKVDVDNSSLDIIYERSTGCRYKIMYYTRNLDGTTKEILGEDSKPLVTIGTAVFGSTVYASNVPINGKTGYVPFTKENMPSIKITKVSEINELKVVFENLSCKVTFKDFEGNQIGEQKTFRYGHELTESDFNDRDLPNSKTVTIDGKEYSLYKNIKWDTKVGTKITSNIDINAIYEMYEVNCFVINPNAVSTSRDERDFSGKITLANGLSDYLDGKLPVLADYNGKENGQDKWKTETARKLAGEMETRGCTISWGKPFTNGDGTYHIDGYIVPKYTLKANYWYGTNETDRQEAAIIDVEGYTEKVSSKSVTVNLNESAKIEHPILDSYSIPTSTETYVSNMTQDVEVDVYYNTENTEGVTVEYYRDNVSEANRISSTTINIVNSIVNNFEKVSNYVTLNAAKPDATYFDGVIVTTIDNYHNTKIGTESQYIIQVVYTKIPVTITPSTTSSAATSASTSESSAVLGATREVVGDNSAIDDPAVLGASRTSDNNNMIIWVIAMVASLGVIAIYVYKKKKLI